MENNTLSTKNFKLKPIVSAITLAFGTVAYAEEAVDLPTIEVQGDHTGAYKIDKSANRKFTADFIDMPKSITVISEQVMQDSGSQTFSEALRMTPGITLGGGEGGIAIGDRPFIRGFDAFSSVFIDGVRDIGSQTREIFAVEQMEILKGPSGAFDGRGSAGGSINLVTKQARKDEFISGSIGFGTDSYRRATIDGNTVLGDNAAVRMVGMVHDADVAGRDEVEVKRWGMMPSLTLGLNSPTKATISWYHLETDDTPDWGLPYVQDTALPQGSPVGNKDTWVGINGRDFMETESDIATLAISHEFNDRITLSNTTRYGVTTNEYYVTRPNINSAQLASGIVNRSSARDRGNRTETVTNLTDLSVAFETGSIKHSLNTGFEISREENRNRGFNGGTLAIADRTTSLNNPDNNPAFSPVERDAFPSAESEAVNRSIYVFDTMELTEKWLLNVGIRYDDYSSEVQNRNSTTGAGTSKFENDSDFFNYQLGLVYKVQPDLNVYASYATSTSPVGLSLGDFSYAGGGLNEDTEDLSPEKSETFEIGTKWNVLDDLELTAAVFHTLKTNARVSLGETTANVGEAEVNGFEFSFAGNIIDNWSLFGGYTYLDAKQTEVGDDPDANQFGAAGTKGKQLPGIAKQSASIWTTYKVSDFTVGGGAFYMDKVYSNPGNTGYVPSYVRWDAMAKYDINQNLDLQLNVQNLTDERYFSTTYFRHYAIVAPGRSAFLTLNFNY